MARTGRILDQKNQPDNGLEPGGEGVPRIQLPQEPFGQLLCVFNIAEPSGRLEFILDGFWLLNGRLRVDLFHTPIMIVLCSSNHGRQTRNAGQADASSNIKTTDRVDCDSTRLVVFSTDTRQSTSWHRRDSRNLPSISPCRGPLFVLVPRGMRSFLGRQIIPASQHLQASITVDRSGDRSGDRRCSCDARRGMALHQRRCWARYSKIGVDERLDRNSAKDSGRSTGPKSEHERPPLGCRVFDWAGVEEWPILL